MHPKKILPLVAVALWCALPLRAAGEKHAGPFRPLAFDAACAAAKSEGKLVFIDFYTVWCEPCQRLDNDTWTDAAVGKLVGDKAVALKLDAEKEGRDLAKRYKIEAYPTLLLLQPDGTERDRIVGYREPLAFTAEFNAGAAGQTALIRAAGAATSVPASGVEMVQARYTFAQMLTRNEKYAEALGEFLWCYDEGMVDETAFAGVRTSFLTGELGRLAKKYPPARAALVIRRDDAKARLLASTTNRRAATEFAALNEALGENAASRALFEQLPAGDVRRRGFGYRFYSELVAEQRYADALEVQPYATMVKLFDYMIVERPALGKNRISQSNRALGLKSAATNVEVLAGAGELDHASEMIAKILEADSSDETRALLHEKLVRAGHDELLPPAPAKP